MTCRDTRELLSALLDEALDARERARVQGHLEGCADCRRELDGLRSAVSLLSRAERARAPVGFVDKVMAGVHPLPWYRRLGRMVFLPLSVKLPIEAGAMVMIALLGVYLLQSTSELKDAARPDLPAVASRAEPPAAPPAPPALAPAPFRERDAKPKSEAPPAAGGDRGRANMARPLEEAQAPSEARQEAKGVLRQSAPPASEPTKPEAPSPGPSVSKTLDSREGSADRADAARKSAAGAAPAASSVMSAKQQLAPPAVSGVLTVKDRQQAERALADLISRMGVRETGWRQDGGATVVDVLVPQADYAAFTKELGELGSLRIEGQAAEVPVLIVMSIRISSE